MQQTICPKCQSKAFKRNGFTRHGKQNHRCLDCGRQFCIEELTSPASMTFDHSLCLTIERIESDEFWSSGNRENKKQWMWIATDVYSKRVIAFYMDSELTDGLQELWKLIPEEYRRSAIIYTESVDLFKKVLDEQEHHRVFKLVDKKI